MKNTRQQLDIITAYQQLGSLRGAAALCGTNHHTVKKVVERVGRGAPLERTPRVLRRNTDEVLKALEEKVRATDGRITAKRLLPLARTAGYEGSARNLRRAVHDIKKEWKRKRRIYRPWLPTPGEYLVIDWTVLAGLHIFCAVLPWSRYRFVRFARDEKRETTLRLLVECFEELGGIPAVVLSDRMSCLKNGVVANLVVPHPDYVRFAAHHGFRPDFCEAADPESKGVVENLVRYAQIDLAIPAEVTEPDAGNRAAVLWGLEVNGRVHSETQAVPLERLAEERKLLRPLPSLRPPLRSGEPRKVDRLQTVRFGSARYSVPTAYVGVVVEIRAESSQVVIQRDGKEVARHPLMAPGEASILDEHYPPRARRPQRPIRIRTATEVAFIGLGPVGEDFLRAAAAVGTSRLPAELADILNLETSWGRPALLAALARAVRFRRFKAKDVRDILAASESAPNPTAPGLRLELDLPEVPVRSLTEYALQALR